MLLILLSLGLLDDLHGDEEDQEHNGRQHHTVADALAVLAGWVVDIEFVGLNVAHQVHYIFHAGREILVGSLLWLSLLVVFH